MKDSRVRKFRNKRIKKVSCIVAIIVIVLGIGGFLIAKRGSDNTPKDQQKVTMSDSSSSSKKKSKQNKNKPVKQDTSNDENGGDQTSDTNENAQTATDSGSTENQGTSNGSGGAQQTAPVDNTTKTTAPSQTHYQSQSYKKAPTQNLKQVRPQAKPEPNKARNVSTQKADNTKPQSKSVKPTTQRSESTNRNVKEDSQTKNRQPNGR